jgi:hypothetical protein
VNLTPGRYAFSRYDKIQNVIEEADKEVMPTRIGQDSDGQEAPYSPRYRKGNPIEMMEEQNDLPDRDATDTMIEGQSDLLEIIPIDTVIEGTEDINRESRKPT